MSKEIDEAMTLVDDGDVIIRVLSNVLTRLIDVNLKSQQQHFVTKFQSSYAPGITIHAYLERIRKYARCSDACFIVALIYIDRIIEIRNVVLTALNVHRILITSVLVAAKFFDDEFYNNAFYAKLGGVPAWEMNSLELEFLHLVNFSLYVKEECFTKYHRELRNYLCVTDVSHSLQPSPIPCESTSRDAVQNHISTHHVIPSRSNAACHPPSRSLSYSDFGAERRFAYQVQPPNKNCVDSLVSDVSHANRHYQPKSLWGVEVSVPLVSYSASVADSGSVNRSTHLGLSAVNLTATVRSDVAPVSVSPYADEKIYQTHYCASGDGSSAGYLQGMNSRDVHSVADSSYELRLRYNHMQGEFKFCPSQPTPPPVVVNPSSRSSVPVPSCPVTYPCFPYADTTAFGSPHDIHSLRSPIGGPDISCFSQDTRQSLTAFQQSPLLDYDYGKQCTNDVSANVYVNFPRGSGPVYNAVTEDSYFQSGIHVGTAAGKTITRRLPVSTHSSVPCQGEFPKSAKNSQVHQMSSKSEYASAWEAGVVPHAAIHDGAHQQMVFGSSADYFPVESHSSVPSSSTHGKFVNYGYGSTHNLSDSSGVSSSYNPSVATPSPSLPNCTRDSGLAKGYSHGSYHPLWADDYAMAVHAGNA